MVYVERYVVFFSNVKLRAICCMYTCELSKQMKLIGLKWVQCLEMFCDGFFSVQYNGSKWNELFAYLFVRIFSFYVTELI